MHQGLRFLPSEDVSNVVHERACRAHDSRCGHLNREGAKEVLWPCDPMIDGRWTCIGVLFVGQAAL
jgi:hypothetical protein